MKKMNMAMVVGAVVFVLSACAASEDPEETQTNLAGGAVKISDDTEETKETQKDEIVESFKDTPAEKKDEEHSAIDVGDVLESLAGEYNYLSHYGTGRLTIQKISSGYDISDYETEFSYRFLADSSNIETVEDGRIYIKYPEQVFSDGETVFGYYILEYDTDGIDVYYGKSGFEGTEFLYHATKKIETAAENAYPEKTAEELLDSFINGSIGAVYAEDPTSTFYITNLMNGSVT